jgi:DNA-binding transcriptional LysR family regulator
LRLNLARFDLVSIRLAVACLQTGSLSAAAREAHLALAAASRRLRELETTLGDTLFDRHARGLTPTAAGRVFVKHGLNLLQTMDQLGAELADQRQGIARHVRLCASTAAINQFLPPLLASYTKLAAHVRIELDEQVSEAVVNALREGRADVGVFVEGPDIRGLHTAPFRQDELVLVMPAGHALSKGRSAIAFADCLDEDWISLTGGAAMLQTQQQAAVAIGRPLRLRMQVRSFDAVCHLVAAGMGVALLPKAAFAPLSQTLPLRSRPLADAWARRQLLVATASQDETVLALVQFLAQPSQNAKARTPKQQ